MTAPAAPVARNDPCPCGSGKRFKQCHGALPDAASAPATPESLTREGMAAHQRGDLAKAEDLYRRALALAPDAPAALHYLGMLAHQRGRTGEAMPLLERATALAPREPEFHNNLGLVLAAAQRDDEAIRSYRAALDLNPRHAGAWNNLGLALQVTGDVDGALAAFRRGLEIAPGFPALHWNLGLALLLRGDYAAGWREYEWRERTPEFAPFLQRYPGPRWTGGDPAGRTLLVCAEQGLGDAIQTLRFARPLAERGARVLAVVPSALRALAATAPGVAEARTPEDAPPSYDAHAMLMSLPGMLGATPDTVGRGVPYLHADPQRVREAQARIAAPARARLRVGIAWSGAPGNTLNARRSIALALLAPLLACDDVAWFSLKREGEIFDAGDASHTARLVELPMRNDLDGIAAMIAALDLVVSVDTSIAHLAGALGKPVWVLLARVPDWRWMLERPDSPWYPTARLFRQRIVGDWSVPVAELADALRARLAQRQD